MQTGDNPVCIPHSSFSWLPPRPHRHPPGRRRWNAIAELLGPLDAVDVFDVVELRPDAAIAAITPADTRANVDCRTGIVAVAVRERRSVVRHRRTDRQSP